MQTRRVKQITQAHEIRMGDMKVGQPLPTQAVTQVDPFLLLHHFGPMPVAPGEEGLDVGPHPHRGFEPVTFLYKGGILHRDSRGNTGNLQGGDVQWMTAGRGIIHSEQSSPDFIRTGGIIEGIQLWVNLPKAHKMVQPRYQDIKSDQIPVWRFDGQGAELRVVAGEYAGLQGPAQTYTPISALQLSLPAEVRVEIALPAGFSALAYFLEGEAQLNDNWNYQAQTMIEFQQEGEGIVLKGIAPSTQVLILAGAPIDEPVVQWGPYVMNTQTEILEAMRDYQMGKMGVYID